MNDRGFSLVELMIAVCLLGGVGLFVSSYMDKLQTDTNRVQLKHEMMDLRARFEENFSNPEACLENLSPILTLQGLDKKPLKILPEPLELKSITQMKFVLLPNKEKKLTPVGTIKENDKHGEITISRMELIGSVLNPNVAMKELVTPAGSETPDVEKYYRTHLRVMVTKGKGVRSSFILPFKLTFDNSQQLIDCRLGGAGASSTPETCTSILRESGQSQFQYAPKRCAMKIKNREYQIHSADATNGILCQMQKKIKAIRPMDAKLNPTHCP